MGAPGPAAALVPLRARQPRRVWTAASDDPGLLLKLARDVVLFTLLCLAAAIAAQRRRQWLDRASSATALALRGSAARPMALGALSLLERLFPELLLFVLALVAPAALGRVAEIAEIGVVLDLFLLSAVYRLLLAATYLGIAWLSVGTASLAPRLRMLTLRSLRLIGLYLLVTLVVLELSENVLGRGCLYSLVANIWWIGGLPIGAVLVRWWQPDIVEGYLAFRGTGPMADAVRATRQRWYGFSVAARDPEVVIGDEGHLLFSRQRGGFDAWDAFAAIAGTAASRTFWLVALARFPHQYLTWARNGLTAPFRRVWALKPRSDEEIAALLRTRTAAAGYHVRYDDLVVDRIERLSPRERFILAALVWHQTVTAPLAAAVLRYPEACAPTRWRCCATGRCCARSTVRACCDAKTCS